MTGGLNRFLNSDRIIRRRIMGTSLISAFISAQAGQLQLAVAARLSRMDANNPQNATSVAQLIDAAQQNFAPLANVAAGLGTNLDVSA
jgi:hypothetical protein